MNSFGYIQSIPSSTDITAQPPQIELPENYDLRKSLPPIRNQGSVPKCVSCVVTDMLDWRVRVEGDNISFSDDLIFKNRSDKSVQGMSPKEAFEFTRVTGVPADSGNRRIKAYAKVTSQITAKSSILAYGPILIALPCYSESDRFWDKTSTLLGGHAVSLVGWEANTFILRNSWGPSYGRGGYSFFDYDDFAKILESWVIIS